MAYQLAKVPVAPSPGVQLLGILLRGMPGQQLVILPEGESASSRVELAAEVSRPQPPGVSSHSIASLQRSPILIRHQQVQSGMRHANA